jgi:hypothetical protein
MTFALGKLADLLHEGKRFPEIAESKCALDAAGIIAQLPIRSLRLEAQGLIARKRRNTAATRRACFLGETLGHVFGSQSYREATAGELSAIDLSEHDVERADDRRDVGKHVPAAKKSRAAQRNGSYS